MKLKDSSKTAIFILSILAWFVAINAWILRLPCTLEADFTQKVDGFALTNNVIGRHTVTSLVTCYEHCISEDKCFSLNYKETGSNNCELNSKIKELSRSTDFIARPTWAYHTTNYNTTKVGSLCNALDPCGSSSICMDSCACPGYQCTPCITNRTAASEEICKFYFIENLALKKPAKQSNDYDRNTLASKAVDGSYATQHQHIAITKRFEKPWWRVDLEKTARVNTVKVMNREDSCCWKRLSPFDIRIGASFANNGSSNPLCYQSASIATPAELKTFKCIPELVGRYVSIHINRNGLLEITEVEVYGFFITG